MMAGSSFNVSRREALGALAASSLAGCQQLERLRDPEQFKTGSASWRPGSGNVPAESWPMARHDAKQSGGGDQITGPEPPLDRHWTVDMGTGGIYPIVAADGRVFAAKTHPNGRLFALDAETGKELWRYETKQNFTASPAVAEGTVYTQEVLPTDDQSEVVRAFDVATGTPQWKHEFQQRRGGDVLVANGTVYVAAGGRLVALDAASGAIAWWYRPGYPYRRLSSIAVGPERVYATAHTDNAGDSHSSRPVGGIVFALDPAQETVDWSVELTQPSNVSVAGYRVIVQDGDDLYGLGIDDGTTRWRAPLGGYLRGSAAAATPKFAISNGGVHHQTAPADGDASGAAVATISLDDGTERARYELQHPGVHNPDPALSVAGDRLYAVTWADESWIDIINVAIDDRQRTVPSIREDVSLVHAGMPSVADGTLFLPAGDRAVVALR